MQLTSRAFEQEGSIPPQHTCDGEEVNVPLDFVDVPEGTKSFVLFMEDPDVPLDIREDGLWDHWIVFNIPGTVRHVEEGEEPEGNFGEGTSGNMGYIGPCPPDGEHRYFFRLYALDTLLDLPEGASKWQIKTAMDKHVLSEAVLMGRYERNASIPLNDISDDDDQ